MPSPEEWKRKLEALIEAGKAVDKAIAEGFHIPMRMSSLGISTGTLGIGLKDREDPNLYFKLPGTVDRPNISLTFTMDLDWHDKIGL
jgi:hypothetical protein